MNSSYYRKHYRSKISSGRLLALGIAVFACAIGVSAASTYAWYAISETGRLGGFNMQINTDLTVQLGKKENGEIVYRDGPFTLAEFGYDKPELDNRSGMSCVNYPEEYDETFNPTYTRGYGYGGDLRMPALATDGYVQLEFYVLASRDAFLYLTSDTKAVVDQQANAYAAQKRGVPVDELNNVPNATRVSFYSPLGYVVTELGAHEEVNYCGPLDIVGNGYYAVDEEGKELLYGLYEGNPRYSAERLPYDRSDYVERDCFHAAHRQGTYELDQNSYAPVKEQAGPISDYVYVDGYTRSKPVAAVQGNVPTRLVVTVFLEGWDHDMTDAIVEASFGLDLGFTALFTEEAKSIFAQ